MRLPHLAYGGDYNPEQWPEAGVSAVVAAPDGVEAVRRGAWLFLLDHGVEEVDVSVPSGGMELITGRALEADRLRLGPRDVAIVRPA